MKQVKTLGSLQAVCLRAWLVSPGGGKDVAAWHSLLLMAFWGVLAALAESEEARGLGPEVTRGTDCRHDHRRTQRAQPCVAVAMQHQVNKYNTIGK